MFLTVKNVKSTNKYNKGTICKTTICKNTILSKNLPEITNNGNNLA